MSDFEHEALIVHLARCFPFQPPREIAAFANRLQSLARQAQAFAVADCNGELNEKNAVRQSDVHRHLREHCEGWNIPVKVGGDPRGYVVKITLPNGAHNSFGGASEGWGVS